MAKENMPCIDVHFETHIEYQSRAIVRKPSTLGLATTRCQKPPHPWGFTEQTLEISHESHTICYLIQARETKDPWLLMIGWEKVRTSLLLVGSRDAPTQLP
jgi:hypothetical protein